MLLVFLCLFLTILTSKQVSVRNNDDYLECSCKFNFRRGYLCRHAFVALYHCSIKKNPSDIYETSLDEEVTSFF